MEQVSLSGDEAFSDVLSQEEAVIRHTRQRFEAGEILQGRQYEPLPDNSEEAFAESLSREKESIDKAKEDLSKRSSIYG